MKIHNKLFLILFSFSFLLITSLVLLMQWSIGQGMIDYVNAKEVKALQPLVSQFAQRYQRDSSWRSFEGDERQFFRLVIQQLVDSQFVPDIPPRKREPHRQRLERSMTLDRPVPPEHRLPPGHAADYALLDSHKKVIVGHYKSDLKYTDIPIELNDKVIGYLAVSKRKGLVDGYELDFLEQQTSYLWLIGLIALSCTLLITFFLARNLVGPVKKIAKGMHQLSQGNFEHQLKLKRHDEIGQLSEDYNTLALTLAHNEQVRKRWLANTSHELRTPIAILMGELEAMQLGVRPLSVENIRSANDEAHHLKRLIEDLHMLNSAELGGMHFTMQPLSIAELLLTVKQKYTTIFKNNAIELNITEFSEEITISADNTRLMQLFGNILMNAVHYAQCSKLQIAVTKVTSISQNYVVINIEDNGIGVEDEHLAHLFEYLYRVDDARNRQQGGSGLGLSLCQHIVHAHQGEIAAMRAPLGGLGIMIKLPMEY
ncbi:MULTISPECIES: ATP-binding protein [Pseudoalteromonas]|uniref:ATP-binding protein n=1 Tax=Pseudoalteromonas TaxID=53246 RepID=UPI000382BD3B|nr:MULTISPECIES: ATP-binding protein [Pseudoalteromonas]MCF6144659.1 two-component system, OmpR family, sensor histidine kinase BaeS [Pseudoalteromonas mariniglutinosa NCIMB 1770]